MYLKQKKKRIYKLMYFFTVFFIDCRFFLRFYADALLCVIIPNNLK